MSKDPTRGRSVVRYEGPASVAAGVMTLTFLLWLYAVESWRPPALELQLFLVGSVAVGQLSLMLLMRWSWNRNRVAGLLAIAGFLIGWDVTVWLLGGHWRVAALSATLGAVVGYLWGLVVDGRIVGLGDEPDRLKTPAKSWKGVAEVAGILGELAAKRFVPNVAPVVGFGVNRLADLASDRVVEWNESRRRKRCATSTFWEPCRTWMLLATVLLTAQTALLQPFIQDMLDLPFRWPGHVSLWFVLLFWVAMVLASLVRTNMRDGTGALVGKDPRRTKRPALVFIGFGLPVATACLAWLLP